MDIINTVTLVLTGIAGISLIVGGVGIMTTMYTSVLERTRQIGIMKSVGARNSNILLMFVIEAGILGLVGGIIGMVIGTIFSEGLEYIITVGVNIGVKIDISVMQIGPEIGPFLDGFNAVLPREWTISILLFSFLVGCISGYLPAKRASEMHPVDALRYR